MFKKKFQLKRLFDIFFSIFALIILILPLITIYIAVFLTSSTPIIFWSDRVGKNNKIFKMPKFRSMRNFTPLLPKEKLNYAYKWFTPIGAFLRKTSLDELPQIWCVLKGEMSIIGPRPALYNQHDLIELRNKYKIYKIRPGITGWAQVNGRDNITLKQKVLFDDYYLRKYSFWLDMKIIFLTVIKVLTFEGYKH